MALLGRPIFIGFVMGLLLGDVKTGILIGAQLELGFLGIVAIGAGMAANPAIATIMTVALAILNDMPAEAVIPLGMTIGYAASVLQSLRWVIAEMFVPAADKALAAGNDKKFTLINWGGTFVGYFLIAPIVSLVGILVGGDLLAEWINNLPSFVLNGIGAAGAILPALGIAMILSLLMNKRMAIYFLSGFVIYKYLGVDMIFMLVIGLLIALADFFVSSEIAKIRDKTSIDNAEEDFLS
jgi:PTS system mannose-specific IIC component